MRLYLDIDGTLIHEDLGERWGQPAEGLATFLEATEPFAVSWLTTHCMDGDPTRAQKIVKQHLPSDVHYLIDRIEPTRWQTYKTEALDPTEPFIWFDNDIMDVEWDILSGLPEDRRAVEVDLVRDPRQLIALTRELVDRARTHAT